MARNNIQFKGTRHSPSDITGQDGDLLECVNLIHENGELKPLELPEVESELRFAEGFTIAAIHNVPSKKIFISVLLSPLMSHVKACDDDGNTIYFGQTPTKSIDGEKVLWVDSVGNTLVVGTDRSIYYAFYKNGAYKWLGDKIPQPVFKFDFRRSGVATDENGDPYGGYYINEFKPNTPSIYPDDGVSDAGQPVEGGGIAITYNSHIEGDRVVIDAPVPVTGINNPIVLANDSEENRIIIRDSIRSKVAKAIAKMRSGDVFAFPFFVRYAVKMYDGSYTMHSAPILMIPSTLENPLLCYIRMSHLVDNKWVYPVGHDAVRFCGMDLTMEFSGWTDDNGNPINDISNWADIIDGVDIFLSSEVSSYNERGWDNALNFPKEFYTFLREDGGGNRTENNYGHCYSRNKKLNWYDIFEKGTNPTQGLFDENETIADEEVTSHEVYRYYRVPLPSFQKKEMMEKLKNTNLFYKVKDYKLSSLNMAWGSERRFRAEVQRGTIERLESLPQLPDDYISRSRIAAKTDYSYNQRLIIGNLNVQLPLWYNDAKTWSSDFIDYVIICFVIEKQERTIYVRYELNSGVNRLGQMDFGHYLFYPDPDCKKAIVWLNNNGARYFEVPMEEHTGLHGSFAIMPDIGSLWESYDRFDQYTGSVPQSSEDRYYSMQNSIAMSEVTNPFGFRAANFKDIGKSHVIGIASNMLDVSSGQWGQYPLFVFCADGILAIAIDGEGKMGGVRAVSSDVLIEQRVFSQPTLIQTDQVLVFLTQRGVMQLAGTRVSCISESMEGRSFDALSDLNPNDNPSVLYDIGAFGGLVMSAFDNRSFIDFAKTGFLAYDYAHHRVLLLNPTSSYQYLYSMKTGLWSKEVVYDGEPFQLASVPGNTTHDGVQQTELEVSVIKAAVNNYTEMYMQDGDGRLYRTMELTEENAASSLYQYGFFVSRPVRLGTDEYKTIKRILHRYTHYADNSFVKLRLYGSRDGVRYGMINTLRGMSYRYFIFVVYTYMKPNERYSYLSVDYETRLTDKLR